MRTGRRAELLLEMAMRRLGFVFVLMTVLLLSACNLTRSPAASNPSVTEIPLVIASPTFVFDRSTVTLTAPVPLTPVTGPIEGINPACPPPPGWIPYAVQAGDSLGLLAMQTNSSIGELVTANCLADPDQIYSGQVLFLPRQPAPQG
ncbi:MAG: LysM peptidoglycan-binding domain-containing protein [Candidatus Flexifilum sp.]